MICPTCGWDNLPGNEECINCQQDLTPLDRPVAANRVERSLMEDPVSLLQPKKPVTIRASTPLHSVLQAMLACDVGSLLVTAEDGTLLGILSERDLLTKVAGLRDPYDDLPAGDFMTPNPVTVDKDAPLNFALHKMDGGGYRHIPVLDRGKPISVLSVRDMLRHIVQLCK
jgi:CBS domain-containing protein